MKKIVLLFALVYLTGFAQTIEIDSSLSASIENLFSAARKSNFKSASDFIAYSGNDASRKYSSKLNSSVNDELQVAERITKKIKAYLDISDSYEIGETKIITENEQEFVMVDTALKSGKQILNIEFKFVRVSGVYLLVGIE